ncbi:MAG: oxidoreductase [Verrucomicrobia bacterium RIFCSPHIGHO2_12_FULL_41_10]|nr:MAG: oxidoreductase [Verrucomicrobia bacterium RIFCSPHIGHO2_12_FULL_41_10]HLB34418.1 Gfo/Idh/MocA family oxidoreductase [Chthoniobacterales bacterium]
MKIIKAGVVGVGHIGINHARIYSELPNCELVAILDANSHAAKKAAAKYGAKACESLEEFTSLVDAATIATPTESHYDVGSVLLRQGKHLLIEKPLADTTEKAQALATLATEHGCILQVGHIERFNPALEALEQELKNPRFLEVTRLSPYPHRSMDIGVVLDLMIHDLEIVLHLVRSPVVSVDPVGVAVLSRGEDIANVRLHFENGCVANLTASRISRDKVRKIRIFQEDAYLSLDYQKQNGYMLRLNGKAIKRHRVKVVKGEPLQRELAAFIDCARSGDQPRVTGHEATAALDLALRITRQIAERK